MAANTVEDSHYVIAMIDRFIAREQEYQCHSHSLTENHISIQIMKMLEDLKNNELKFLDTFNQEGAIP